ncbi:hypothetical protein LINPERHAP2_LOCUS34563 [Linum perenne]
MVQYLYNLYSSRTLRQGMRARGVSMFWTVKRLSQLVWESVVVPEYHGGSRQVVTIFGRALL